MSHLQDLLLSAFLRSLSTADAGALLHLLACPACAAKATAALGFPPTGEALAVAQRRLGGSGLDRSTDTARRGESAAPQLLPEDRD